MNPEILKDLEQSSKVNDSIVILRSILEQMSEDIRELRREISDLKKPKYNLLLGMGGILLTTIAGLWGLAISPIKEELALKSDKNVVQEKYASKEELNRLTLDVNNRFNMISHGAISIEKMTK